MIVTESLVFLFQLKIPLKKNIKKLGGICMPTPPFFLSS